MLVGPQKLYLFTIRPLLTVITTNYLVSYRENMEYENSHGKDMKYEKKTSKVMKL